MNNSLTDGKIRLVYTIFEKFAYNLLKNMILLYYYLQQKLNFLKYVDFTKNQTFRVCWDVAYVIIVIS